MRNYRTLRIWKRSVEFSTGIYELTINFPNHELYGISSQMRRSSVSIPSNIAEGAGRDSDKEFIRFLSIAIASSFELETQLIIANKLKYIDDSNFEFFQRDLNSIQKQIVSYKKKIDIYSS